MKYKIGEVARILGISADLIRYYEEKGVVTPAKDPQNNYRYYDTWDINYLIDCLWYKNFGFGIEKVASMVTECSFDGLLGTLEEKGVEILASIRRQELLLQRIKKFQERLANTKSCVGTCDVRTCSGFYYYINRRNTEYDNREGTADVSRRWLKYMPFTRRYFEIPDGAMAGGLDEYEWGFSIAAQYIEEFGVSISPPVHEMPSRLCIHSAFKSAGQDRFSARKLDFLLDYARANGYSPERGAFGNLACSVMEDGEQTGYFEVWLPVREDAK
ncbi:MAG: MerR family transcriptional regulator [Oscillospiraceae bacterium]|jgi:DNA-binding transcriptional MerR regulator|nr:MerR family transcriptional regulator [Oscillospiraceae bacterium]